jgi:hypothetical protein
LSSLKVARRKKAIAPSSPIALTVSLASPTEEITAPNHFPVSSDALLPDPAETANKLFQPSTHYSISVKEDGRLDVSIKSNTDDSFHFKEHDASPFGSDTQLSHTSLEGLPTDTASEVTAAESISVNYKSVPPMNIVILIVGSSKSFSNLSNLRRFFFYLLQFLDRG